MRIYFIRHGSTEANAQGRYLGSTDCPLSPEGRAQAAALTWPIEDASPFLVLCSPLKRCRDSALMAFGEREASLQIDHDLREIDFGEWEGMTFAEIQRHDPQAIDAWRQWRSDFVFPGGEGLRAFMERMQRVKQKLCVLPDCEVILFTHGGVIRMLLCLFLDRPLRDFLQFVVPTASVITLVYREGRASLAQETHLSPLGEATA